MSSKKKQMRAWTITLEHDNGVDQRVYDVIAPTGSLAERWALNRIEEEGKPRKSWHMVGLLRR